MSEPIKLVVIVEGGVIQDILCCGIAVQVAVIDYDTDGEDERNTITVDDDVAVPAVWNIQPTDARSVSDANALFDLAFKAVSEEA